MSKLGEYGPLGLLLIVGGMLVFSASLQGTSYLLQSFPPLLQITFNQCVAAGHSNIPFLGPVISGFSDLGCAVYSGILFAVNIVLILYGFVVLLWNATTFNVPGAPDFVRAVFGILMLGIGFSAVKLLTRQSG